MHILLSHAFREVIHASSASSTWRLLMNILAIFYPTPLSTIAFPVNIDCDTPLPRTVNSNNKIPPGTLSFRG